MWVDITWTYDINHFINNIKNVYREEDVVLSLFFLWAQKIDTSKFIIFW